MGARTGSTGAAVVGWEGAASAVGCRADVSAEDWEAEEEWEVVACTAECWLEGTAEDWEAEEEWEVVACTAECWLEWEDEAGWPSGEMALATPVATTSAVK